MSENIFSFGNKKKNLVMVEGAYRKLKSHYYYNKNFILVREKIVNFENDAQRMQSTFEKLAEIIQRPNSDESIAYVQSLVSKIDFYALPKKFEDCRLEKRDVVSNVGLQNKKLKSVNFFINAPIEIYLLDVLFAFFLAKAAQEKNLISKDVYGNCVYDEVLLTPNFESRRFFKNYFPQYCNWRNRAFQQLDQNYKHNKHSLLISLDLQGYFYSVKFDFRSLQKLRKDSSCNKTLLTLQKIMEPVYTSFKQKISRYRNDLRNHSEKETPLPIGLFSSMVLGNIYLSDFDEKISRMTNVSYYGRYVDDCLFVVNDNFSLDKTKKDVIDCVFKDILRPIEETYAIIGKENLKIQKNKINVIHVDPHQSRALLDIYNKEIRILPSQMDFLPDSDLKLDLFDEKIYNVEGFSADGKIRNIGTISANALAVGSYFNNLFLKFSHVNPNSIAKKISPIIQNRDENIRQIDKFFTGSNIIEYSTHWMSFFYFLVMTRNYRKLNDFYQKVSKSIEDLTLDTLDSNIIAKPVRKTMLITIVKRDLKKQLEIASRSALALSLTSIQKKTARKKYTEVKKYVEANMFNHSLIALPLANYFEYDNDVSYINMGLENIGRLTSIANSRKLKWSPRFIGYEEILLLRFYHNYDKTLVNFEDVEGAFTIYEKVNYIRASELLWWLPNNIAENDDYCVSKISILPGARGSLDEINIAVANMRLDPSFENMLDRWANLSFDYKNIIHNILNEASKVCKEKIKKGIPSLLVMPEASIPVYWIEEIIKFSKRSGIAVITGLQLVKGIKNSAHNYILHVFPFSQQCLDTALVVIREKNDYAPLEKKELSKLGRVCEDRKKAQYYIFEWCGVNISSMVCFELTDICARAQLKGFCDILAVPVFNKDTKYFSNIIESTVRDLYTFVIQANTATYGDSRITGPYNHDNKDILRIKGGENENVIIGTLDLKDYFEYRETYNSKMNDEVEKNLDDYKIKGKVKSKATDKKRPIKPLSARYKKK